MTQERVPPRLHYLCAATVWMPTTTSSETTLIGLGPTTLGTYPGKRQRGKGTHRRPSSDTWAASSTSRATLP
ncbi:unnamed protein product, partial [Ectocarpus sp. 12 AP-2014]